MEFMLEMYKKVFNIFEKNFQISVHCHAGKGRTGMVICAVIFYN